MFLAFAYPFMKRITYWPQLFLGLTFNWGIIMAWTSVMGDISLSILILYFSAIFWTLGYDTIYGAQDMSDDEIIGLKSTSIKFKKNMNLFISISFLIFIILIIYLFNNFYGKNIFTIFAIMFVLTLIYQLFELMKQNSKNYLRLFKFNNYTGILLFISILSINF